MGESGLYWSAHTARYTSSPSPPPPSSPSSPASTFYSSHPYPTYHKPAIRTSPYPQYNGFREDCLPPLRPEFPEDSDGRVPLSLPSIKELFGGVKTIPDLDFHFDSAGTIDEHLPSSASEDEDDSEPEADSCFDSSLPSSPFSCAFSDQRATYFDISSERGRWQFEPSTSPDSTLTMNYIHSRQWTAPMKSPPPSASKSVTRPSSVPADAGSFTKLLSMKSSDPQFHSTRSMKPPIIDIIVGKKEDVSGDTAICMDVDEVAFEISRNQDDMACPDEKRSLRSSPDPPHLSPPQPESNSRPSKDPQGDPESHPSDDIVMEKTSEESEQEDLSPATEKRIHSEHQPLPIESGSQLKMLVDEITGSDIQASSFSNPHTLTEKPLATKQPQHDADSNNARHKSQPMASDPPPRIPADVIPKANVRSSGTGSKANVEIDDVGPRDTVNVSPSYLPRSSSTSGSSFVVPTTSVIKSYPKPDKQSNISKASASTALKPATPASLERSASKTQRSSEVTSDVGKLKDENLFTVSADFPVPAKYRSGTHPTSSSASTSSASSGRSYISSKPVANTSQSITPAQLPRKGAFTTNVASSSSIAVHGKSSKDGNSGTPNSKQIAKTSSVEKYVQSNEDQDHTDNDVTALKRKHDEIVKEKQRDKESRKQKGKQRADTDTGIFDSSDDDDFNFEPRKKKVKSASTDKQVRKNVSHRISHESSSKNARKEESARKPKSSSAARRPHLSGPPFHPPLSEEDTDLVGVIIETLATSRASSLAVHNLYKAVLDSRPSWKQKKTEKEWCACFLRILRSGEAHGTAKGGCGVFAKVETSYGGNDGTDSDPMHAQWFYVSEKDPDQERAGLIRAMIGRPSKRSETKKFKQYYYQPLEKISRWDSEDAD